MPYWPADSLYFITSKVSLNKKIFDNYKKKKIVLSQIKKAVEQLSIRIFAYSISMNHYHVLLHINNYEKHGQFKQIVNGGSAYLYNKSLRETEERLGKMWLDSKSLIINNEKSLLNVIGYISGNLLKHKEVKNFQELKRCPFSSYRQMVLKYGDEEAELIVRRVIDTEESEDCLIDLENI